MDNGRERRENRRYAFWDSLRKAQARGDPGVLERGPACLMSRAAQSGAGEPHFSAFVSAARAKVSYAAPNWSSAKWCVTNCAASSCWLDTSRSRVGVE